MKVRTARLFTATKVVSLAFWLLFAASMIPFDGPGILSGSPSPLSARIALWSFSLAFLAGILYLLHYSFSLIDEGFGKPLSSEGRDTIRVEPRRLFLKKLTAVTFAIGMALVLAPRIFDFPVLNGVLHESQVGSNVQWFGAYLLMWSAIMYFAWLHKTKAG